MQASYTGRPGLPSPPVAVARRPITSSWCFWVVLVLVVGFGSCMFFVTQTLNRALVGTPSKVIYGTPLAWRKLEPAERPDYPSLPFTSKIEHADVALGDFDGDGTMELVLSGALCGTSLIKCDGAATLLDAVKLHSGLQFLAWDYNRDGKDELMDIGDHTQVQVFDLQDKVLAELPGGTSWYGVVLADVNGDGAQELAVESLDRNSLVMYGTGGKEVWRFDLPQKTYNHGFGDVDGDGKVEVIINDNGTLRIFGMDQQEATAPGWSGFYWPSLCADLDGDGRDEVFAANHGYLNLATGAYTELKYGAKGDKRSEDRLQPVVVIDMEGDGVKELATPGLNDNTLNTELFIFKLDGTCIYEEQMGSSIKNIGVLREKDGREHLVVHCDEKLVIYP